MLLCFQTNHNFYNAAIELNFSRLIELMKSLGLRTRLGINNKAGQLDVIENLTDLMLWMFLNRLDAQFDKPVLISSRL
jgi:hypothetical protein